MFRTALKIICIVSGVLFVAFSVFTVFSVASGLERINTSGGIIGGAGAPTTGFLLRNSPSFYPAMVSLLLFAATESTLIFGKKPKK